MTPRLDFARIAPKPYESLISLETYLSRCDIERALMDLTYVIVAINAWNRLAISFRMEAGSYRVQEPHAVGA
jgi:hypothetical protein